MSNIYIFDSRINGIYALLSEFLTNWDKAQLSTTCRRFKLACDTKHIYQLRTNNIDDVFNYPNLRSLDYTRNKNVDLSLIAILTNLQILHVSVNKIIDGLPLAIIIISSIAHFYPHLLTYNI